MSETKLDMLKRRLESPEVAYFRFLQQNPKSTHYVFAFFEGQDDLSFYTNFLERFVSNAIKFPCGGKSGVYETRRPSKL